MGKKSGKMGTGATICLILMVVIGVVFGLGFYTYSKSLRKGIFVFSDNFDAGTQVTKEMFLTQEIDSKTYQAMGAYGKGGMYVTSAELNEYIANGERLAADVVAFMPATTNLFITTGGTGVESRLSDGMAAVEIPVGKVSGLSGNEVGVGSRVNVTSHYSLGGEDMQEQKVSSLVFQDLLILDVVNDEDGMLQSIYVECKPSEAIKLQHSLVFETVSVSILKPGTYTQLEGDENTKYEKNYYNPTELEKREAEAMKAGRIDQYGNVID